MYTMYFYDYIHLLYIYFYCDNHCIMLLLCSKVPNIYFIEGDLLHSCTSQLHWVRSLLCCCGSNI